MNLLRAISTIRQFKGANLLLLSSDDARSFIAARSLVREHRVMYFVLTKAGVL